MNKGIKIITSISAGVAVLVIVNEAVKVQAGEKVNVSIAEVDEPTKIFDGLWIPVDKVGMNYKTETYTLPDSGLFDFNFNFLSTDDETDSFNFDFSSWGALVNNYNKPVTPYDNIIEREEIINNIPRDLLHRLLYQESRFRDDIITGETSSSAGAKGIAQLIPRYHPDPRIYSGTVDPLNPSQAIPYAAKYLKFLYERFNDWGLALAAYNYGETITNKIANDLDKNDFEQLPNETQLYVSQILGDVNVKSVLV